jgi:hypothetical protein
MAQYRQPDFSLGDPNTLGGYMAVHDRPAAFEGSDGFSYSVEILATEAEGGWDAYLFFVKWARIGASAPEGHLESDVLARAASEEAARHAVGSLALTDVKRLLDDLIARDPSGGPRRKWWDAMNADEGEGHHA